jgi:two-component system, NarL family, response regulator
MLKTSIRILIVDDQIVVRAGFSSVLRSHPGLNVVGSVASGEAALILLERCAVEVLLLDLHMPGLGGIETLRALQRLPCPPPVIVLSSFEPEEEICRAIEMGARGYLRKDTSCAEILEAIHTVHSGKCYLPTWIATRISERNPRSKLSPRELEVLEMVAKGLTNKEIGWAFQVSHFTVRNHVRHIMTKLEAGDRTEAATIAIQQGILGGQGRFEAAVAPAVPSQPARGIDFLARPPVHGSEHPSPWQPRKAGRTGRAVDAASQMQ